MTFLLALALAAPPPAETLFINGRFHTPTGDAEAVAVRGGRIIAVGKTADLQAKMAQFPILDLEGKRVVPGFYDSHVHLLGGGLQLARVELKDAPDAATFQSRVKAFDQKLPRDRWMLGGNWDHDRAFGGKLPTKADLDAVAPNRPIFLRRYDGHMGLANSAALKLANITAATKDPAGGVIYRAPDGTTPTGVLKDNAMDLVEAVIPDPPADEVAEAVRAALAEAARFGVTSVQDMEGSSPAGRRALLRMLQNLEARDELTCRVNVRWPIALYQELTQLGVEANFGSDWVRIGGVKGFMDGSLGSSTAKMFDPFVGEPTNTGVFVTEPSAMRTMIRNCDAAGLSVAIHAIGDRANADLLDLFKDAITANGPRAGRLFRVEHAQHLRPEEFTEFKQLNVIASMQPFHVVDDGRWAVGRIGDERCASSYAFHSILKAGGTLAFGSDWPVAPLDPLTGMRAAVTRQTLDGKHPDGWHPSEKLTARQSLDAYTIGSAAGAGQTADRGSIEAGKLADFAVLSADVLAASVDWDALKVDATIVGGKVVFKRE